MKSQNYRLDGIETAEVKGLAKITSAFVLKERGKDARIYSEDGCFVVETNCSCNTIKDRPQVRSCYCVDHCETHKEYTPCSCDNDCSCNGYHGSFGTCDTDICTTDCEDHTGGWKKGYPVRCEVE